MEPKYIEYLYELENTPENVEKLLHIQEQIEERKTLTLNNTIYKIHNTILKENKKDPTKINLSVIHNNKEDKS